MKLLRAISTVAATSALAVAAAPAHAAPTPKLGLYDCYSYNASLGGLQYHHSIRLKSGAVYQHGYRGDKGKLKSQKNGTWSRKGARITFKTGVLRKTYAKAVKRENRPEAVLALFAQGDTTSGIDCYFNKEYR